MSRIYDALQRADLERRAAGESDPTETAEPFLAPQMEEQPAVKTGILEEKIVRYAWNPSLLSLPTLGDRGEHIEQFRGLRSHIYQLNDQAPLKTILVCSGEPGEGKSFVATNLAMSMARNRSSRVLLIDADLRSPVLHSILGAPPKPGLTEFLAGAAEANSILQRSNSPRNAAEDRTQGIPDLTFIPAGSGGSNSAELIASHRFEELVATVAPHFDWIVIDSPPVMAFADGVDLARAADGVLLVARAETTTYEVAQRAQAAFCNSRVLGFVLNAARNVPSNDYYYYYGRHEAEHGAPRTGKGRKR